MKRKDKLLYAVIAGVVVILLVIIGVWFFKNYSEEVIHTSGVVVNQKYNHWTTQEPVSDSNGKITHYNTIHHFSWKTKVQVEDDKVFTDNSRYAYENYTKGQIVKVNKVLCYFQGKYLFTDYRIAR